MGNLVVEVVAARRPPSPRPRSSPDQALFQSLCPPPPGACVPLGLQAYLYPQKNIFEKIAEFKVFFKPIFCVPLVSPGIPPSLPLVGRHTRPWVECGWLTPPPKGAPKEAWDLLRPRGHRPPRRARPSGPKLRATQPDAAPAMRLCSRVVLIRDSQRKHVFECGT